jgi:hypothetical protein
MVNTVVEDTIPVIEDIIHVIEDTIPVIEDTIAVIEDTIPVIEDKPIVKKAFKKSSKKATKKSEEEIDFDEERYLECFKAKTNYTNEQRISIFKYEFNTELSDRKIGSIINKYFKVSSAHIGGKKTKVYQLDDFYVCTDEITTAAAATEEIVESEEEYKNRMKKIFIEKQRIIFLLNTKITASALFHLLWKLKMVFYIALMRLKIYIKEQLVMR